MAAMLVSDIDFEERVRASFARQKVMATIGAELTQVTPGMIEIEPRAFRCPGYHVRAASTRFEAQGAEALRARLYYLAEFTDSHTSAALTRRASALPLLARARRAAIVGDPQQLSFVPSLGLGAERALMDANQIPRQGRASLAQSRNSLFDFAQGRPGVHRAFLPDQFRSAPEIVAWLGDEF